MARPTEADMDRMKELFLAGIHREMRDSQATVAEQLSEADLDRIARTAASEAAGHDPVLAEALYERAKAIAAEAGKVH